MIIKLAMGARQCTDWQCHQGEGWVSSWLFRESLISFSTASELVIPGGVLGGVY